MVFRFRQVSCLRSGHPSSLVLMSSSSVSCLAGIAVVAHNNNEPQLEWFMVMNAETGQFQDTAGEDYKLILTGVDAQALAFTDRPERQTQT